MLEPPENGSEPVPPAPPLPEGSARAPLASGPHREQSSRTGGRSEAPAQAVATATADSSPRQRPLLELAAVSIWPTGTALAGYGITVARAAGAVGLWPKAVTSSGGADRAGNGGCREISNQWVRAGRGEDRRRGLVPAETANAGLAEEARTRLSVVIIDDSEPDAELVVRELRRGGFEVTHERVEEREALAQTLKRRKWDIAFNDYSLGGLTIKDSLDVIAHHTDDLPVVCLSGMAGEEVAVEVMRAGARDFICKDKLQRLCSTVRRELLDREYRKQHRQQQRIADARLRQANRLESMGELAAGVAHEINTPIQFIGDNADYLSTCLRVLRPIAKLGQELSEKAPAAPHAASPLQQLSDVAQQYAAVAHELPDAIAQIQDGVHRVSKIVQAMRRFARPNVGVWAREELGALVEGALTITRNEWKYVANAQLSVEPPGLLLDCLPDELSQVFINLIVNAAHAIAPKFERTRTMGEIAISARQSPSGCEIRVADNGVGVPEEIRDKVFDLFFTTKPAGIGTGQGLALAYGVVVNRHGGRIHLESEVGVGTTLVIFLPTPHRTADLQE